MKTYCLRIITIIGLTLGFANFYPIYGAEETKTSSAFVDEITAFVDETKRKLPFKSLSSEKVTKIEPYLTSIYKDPKKINFLLQSDNLEYLQNVLEYLYNIIYKNIDTAKESVEDLINAVILSYKLNLRDKSLLKHIFLEIQNRVTLPIATKFKEASIGIAMPNFYITPLTILLSNVKKVLPNVEKIYFNSTEKDENSYMVEFKKDQLGKTEFKHYNSTDWEEISPLLLHPVKQDLPKTYISTPLEHVITKVFSLDKSKYVVTFTNKTVQVYSSDGQPIGELLDNIKSLNFNSNSSQYVVIFKNKTAQLYNSNGQPISAPLSDVSNVIFLNKSKYLVKFENKTDQLYDSNLIPIGKPLNDVYYAQFSPDGSKYLVTFNNETVQLYGPDEPTIGEILDGAKSVNFDSDIRDIGKPLNDVYSAEFSPDSSKYLIKFNNGTAQLYNSNGQAIGELLDKVENVKFSPDGLKYFIAFKNKTAQLYNSNGQAIGKLLDKVENVKFNSDGSKYLVIFCDRKGQLYDSNGRDVKTIFDIEGVSKDESICWIKINDKKSVIIEIKDLFLDMPLQFNQFLILSFILNKHLLTNKPVLLNIEQAKILGDKITSNLIKKTIITFYAPFTNAIYKNLKPQILG